MKKFTLLAGLALLAGTGIGYAQTEVQGLKISTDTEKYYYRISNMRAQRLSYITGTIIDQNGDSIDSETDQALAPLSATLADGTATPEISANPYMGLASLSGNWWLAFSAQPTVVDPNTMYWYFTDGGRTGSVQIHNAVIDGTVARSHQYVTDVLGYSRAAMGFDTDAENRYYVLKVRDSFEETFGGTDELLLDEEDIDAAYALSTVSSFTTESSTCLDMNNYISYTHTEVGIDEATGDTIVDADGNPIRYNHGFAGMDRTWSPIRDNGVNDNHFRNNGSLFFVTEATNAEAEEAIQNYQSVIIAQLQEGAITDAKSQFTSVVSSMKGWLNVPALWADQTALQNIISYCENWNGEGLDVNSVVSIATREAYSEQAAALAQAKLAEAAALVGSGAIVTLQNSLAYRDLMDAEDLADEYQLGDAYITAGGIGMVRASGAMMEAIYDGIAPMLEKTAQAEWELQPIAGTANFNLYNAATGTYIREYRDMYELAGGDDEFGSSDEVDEYSWATTTEKAEAAAFFFQGCADPEAQTAPTEDEELTLDDYNVNTDITNNVRLSASYQVATVDEETGEEGEPETVTCNIHRGSAGSDYQFINYGATKNWWYADSNAFHVDVLVQGGISEVTAEKVKANGIYDLQGRRVAKAGKGIYIINGVKTLVK